MYVAYHKCFSFFQGFEPIIASTKGGKVPIDPKSIQEQYLTASSKDFMKDGRPSLKVQIAHVISPAGNVYPYTLSFACQASGVCPQCGCLEASCIAFLTSGIWSTSAVLLSRGI